VTESPKQAPRGLHLGGGYVCWGRMNVASRYIVNPS
jgi:hypothetical protein